VYVLRMQSERMREGANFVPSLREYTARWGITPQRLRSGQRIMHPGPMNRGVEIDSAVADGPYSVILEQVTNGVAVRMAILYLLVARSKAEDALETEPAAEPARGRRGVRA
jgi:aspartate carbamoyltransferase catalytic subunit